MCHHVKDESAWLTEQLRESEEEPEDGREGDADTAERPAPADD